MLLARPAMTLNRGVSARRAPGGWRPFTALLVAVAVNSASVRAEQHWCLHTRVFGRWAALAHAGLIIPPWIAFLATSRSVPNGDLPVPPFLASRVGALLRGGGVLFTVLGFRELGLGALINLDQFRPPVEPTAAAIYRLLDDPIYTGYALGTAGWALRRRSTSGLLLAGFMYVLLTCVQSPIEKARVRRAG
ncbi:MAG: hypothetical protein DLM66_04255 [Candidatus Dormiibacter spiritus]|uniref:methyltransferase n=1 Tax=Candidatus Dormibacter sp. TaxID=2973982 RepID=UPI000DB2BAC8|nr:MAG: hypothetical protein DLM66_04255 [Candidatus Dormibacteraeota bacterium]